VEIVVSVVKDVVEIVVSVAVDVVKLVVDVVLMQTGPEPTKPTASE